MGHGFQVRKFHLKILRPVGRKALPPAGLGRQAFLPVGKFLKVKKFPYLKLGPFGNPIFCHAYFISRYMLYLNYNMISLMIPKFKIENITLKRA